MTEAELDDLVEQRYDAVDGGEYHDDPEYWERGESCSHQQAFDDDTVTKRVKRAPGGSFEITDVASADTEAMATKYYIGCLSEINGESEYKHQFRFTTAEDPIEYLDGVASRFYDDNGGEKSGDGYLFDAGALFVEAKSVTEVDASTYQTVAPFITQL